MITLIENLPENMVGFKATGEVDERDFTDVVIPKVKELVERTGSLNYMLVLDTSIKNFSMGAWFKDVVMGIKYITKWNRAAIVTDTDGIRSFTEFFSLISPGEFKGFEHKDLQTAIDWCTEKTDLK
ncbi:MAG: STAS/SEC14 domain-containing protein [Bacteroidota bacterium]